MQLKVWCNKFCLSTDCERTFRIHWIDRRLQWSDIIRYWYLEISYYNIQDWFYTAVNSEIPSVICTVNDQQVLYITPDQNEPKLYSLEDIWCS